MWRGSAGAKATEAAASDSDEDNMATCIDTEQNPQLYKTAVLLASPEKEINADENFQSFVATHDKQ